MFLLESRYPIRHGLGRTDSHEFVVGVCRDYDFPAIVKKFNSPRCPGNEKQLMDNAYWPWVKGRKVRLTQWWVDGEDHEKIVQAVRNGTYEPEKCKQVW